jgi:predicted RNA-binding protein with PIN domain
MYKLPELGQLMDTDLERARGSLVAMLADFGAVRNVDVTVVFDGRGLQFVPRGPSRQGGVEVVFSRSSQTADQVIITMLARADHPRSWTVVSSDRSVAGHARDYHARSVSSETFARLLRGRDRGADAGPVSDKPEMTPGDVAEWEEYLKSKGVDTSKGWF